MSFLGMGDIKIELILFHVSKFIVLSRVFIRYFFVIFTNQALIFKYNPHLTIIITIIQITFNNPFSKIYHKFFTYFQLGLSPNSTFFIHHT